MRSNMAVTAIAITFVAATLLQAAKHTLSLRWGYLRARLGKR